MHLETGPHSILYNSPFVCFSAVRLRRAEARQYKQSPSSQAAASAANLCVMTKQQTCIHSACYSTSCLAFRKPEQCVWGGLGSSGNARLCHPAQTHALLFPGAGQTPRAALLPAARSCAAEPGPARLSPALACALGIFLRWRGTNQQSVVEQRSALSWLAACSWAQTSISIQ